MEQLADQEAHETFECAAAEACLTVGVDVLGRELRGMGLPVTTKWLQKNMFRLPHLKAGGRPMFDAGAVARAISKIAADRNWGCHIEAGK